MIPKVDHDDNATLMRSWLNALRVPCLAQLPSINNKVSKDQIFDFSIGRFSSKPTSTENFILQVTPATIQANQYLLQPLARIYCNSQATRIEMKIK